jgi:cysteine synthase
MVNDKVGDRRAKNRAAREVRTIAGRRPVEGIMAGVSSVAAVHAALGISARQDSSGKLVVVVLPDSAECLVTTSLFATMRRAVPRSNAPDPDDVA